MSTDRKPRDEEIDVYGLTDQGKVRKDNQDHFLIASVHRRLHVLQTSLTDPARVPMADDRVAFLAMVADGVGGGVGGQEASATALETATEYIASSSKCFMEGDAAGTEFIETLQAAAHRSHEAVKARAMDIAPGRSMATTLTMYMGVWPYYYLLQVGDSRYYLYRGGALTQVSRDQTIAQDLVDQGVLTRAVAERSRFNDVLSSAIGADEAVPVVTRLKSEWGMVHLLCTDGLIKHVTDERIKEVLATMTSSRQACETLVAEALANGGSDNVTVIIGRTVTPRP
ncbi:MAG: serine/threonine-protein phosphatase [Gemmatimonadetes bacterium]|nr:serine/threonine-protein phosphatase [Gemmatimonadota bacterium]